MAGVLRLVQAARLCLTGEWRDGGRQGQSKEGLRPDLRLTDTE